MHYWNGVLEPETLQQEMTIDPSLCLCHKDNAFIEMIATHVDDFLCTSNDFQRFYRNWEIYLLLVKRKVTEADLPFS